MNPHPTGTTAYLIEENKQLRSTLQSIRGDIDTFIGEQRKLLEDAQAAAKTAVEKAFALGTDAAMGEVLRLRALLSQFVADVREATHDLFHQNRSAIEVVERLRFIADRAALAVDGGKEAGHGG